MPAPEVDRAAELLERLLTDAAFRARFRSSPSDACTEYDLPELADELGGSMKAVFTLEARESKSSLAGVVMAAAAEGVGVFDLVHHVGPA
ncbi:MAG: putative modified peptide, partial [Solirubrobacterales bacterium]|nr:putative modified peptide [Solirubrobacterales bacterium]